MLYFNRRVLGTRRAPLLTQGCPCNDIQAPDDPPHTNSSTINTPLVRTETPESMLCWLLPDDQGVAHVARLVPAAHAPTRVVVSERLRDAVKVLLGVHGAPRRTAKEVHYKQ